MTCHTTAKNGAKARLYKGSQLVDRAKVAGGLVKVHAPGNRPARPRGQALPQAPPHSRTAS